MTRDGIEPCVRRAQLKRAALDHDIEPVWIGRLRLRRVRAGGTGMVSLAHDSELEREVAIEMPHDHVARVRHEANPLVPPAHLNLVSVLGAVEPDGRAVIVTPPVSGSSLDRAGSEQP